jgi:HK97 family phage prohead protease
MFNKGFDLGFKDIDLKQGIVKGQFAKHNVKDLAGDIGEYGMFSKSISERGPQGKKLIKFLMDHDRTKVPAVITELYEENDGGFYEAKVGSHNLGVDFLKMVESGIFNQHSYGYRIIKEHFDPTLKANKLKEVGLYEISAIQFLGANPETTFIEAKNLKDAMSYISILEKFVKTSDATDETLQLLDIQLKSLLEIVKPVDSTSKIGEADKNKITLNDLKKSLESWKN